jgi:membrane protein
MIEKIRTLVNRLINFITYDIWRTHDDELIDWKKANLFNFVKVFVLAIKNISRLNIVGKASALTYSTLLAIVPILAILFAVARGFGFQNIVQSELFKFFAGQETALTKALEFADTSLRYAQGGIFVGIGVILLLYTVISLISGVEQNFNEIWNVKKQRSYYRQFTDYLALILIVPVFMVCNSGITILIGSSIDKLYLLDQVLAPIMKVIPFVIVIILFTFVYIYIPNTKVKFSNALFGGFFAGVAFQAFQMLYISGQIWISKYNAIYGSFAALPLLLMWVQLSWYICLFGMLITQAAQNVKKFSFEKESQNISRRHKDFFTLLIASLIIKRFETGERPYTADELSEKHKIPSKLTGDILYLLQLIGIVVEVVDEVKEVSTFMPAIDIHKITVTFLLQRIDQYGAEDFNKDWKSDYKAVWDALQDYNQISYSKYDTTLLKDLYGNPPIVAESEM